MFLVLNIIATKAIAFIIAERGKMQEDKNDNFNLFAHHCLSQ